jgi:hypothetical protein
MQAMRCGKKVQSRPLIDIENRRGRRTIRPERGDAHDMMRPQIVEDFLTRFHKRLAATPHRPAGTAEIAAILADHGEIAALGT